MDAAQIDAIYRMIFIFIFICLETKKRKKFSRNWNFDELKPATSRHFVCKL